MQYLYYLVSYQKKKKIGTSVPLTFKKMNRSESKGPLFPTTPFSIQQPEQSSKTEIRFYHLPA